MTPLWVIELANEFWRRAKIDDPFPRALRRPISRAVPVTIVYLNRLTFQQATDWLKKMRIACPCSEPDRSLRACLVASSGHGFVFVDGTDPEDEQRYSLAHELGHFLKHYWYPRGVASLRLGEQVCEVFDGLRPPTDEERLDSLLQRVPVGYHVHLMRRDEDGDVCDAAVAWAEEEADLLAYELLAPMEVVMKLASDNGADSSPSVARLLRSAFGLPEREAIAYGDLLVPRPSESFLIRQIRTAK